MVSGIDLATVGGAIVLAAVGGEAFLKGVLGVATWLRLPKLLIATTLAAFATSSPELTVSTIAALAGKPEIGLGDALGSNVVNIALIFGLALLFGPIRADWRDLRRDFGLAFLAPLITLGLLSDGSLSQLDGVLLLIGFVAWISLTIRATASAQQDLADKTVAARPLTACSYSLFGLLALVIAGRLFVSGASSIAMDLGLNAFIVGATVIAIGTSLPELVTVLLARLRGHDEVGVGTLLGSNLFNGLTIVGITAAIQPTRSLPPEITTTLVLGVCALMLLIPNKEGGIPRGRAVLLLCLYLFFISATTFNA